MKKENGEETSTPGAVLALASLPAEAHEAHAGELTLLRAGLGLGLAPDSPRPTGSRPRRVRRQHRFGWRVSGVRVRSRERELRYAGCWKNSKRPRVLARVVFKKGNAPLDTKISSGLLCVDPRPRRRGARVAHVCGRAQGARLAGGGGDLLRAHGGRPGPLLQ